MPHESFVRGRSLDDRKTTIRRLIQVDANTKHGENWYSFNNATDPSAPPFFDFLLDFSSALTCRKPDSPSVLAFEFGAEEDDRSFRLLTTVAKRLFVMTETT